MTAGELRDWLEDKPYDSEVMMFFKCRYDIPKEDAEKGFYGYINGIKYSEHDEVVLMN